MRHRQQAWSRLAEDTREFRKIDGITNSKTLPAELWTPLEYLEIIKLQNVAIGRIYFNE